MLGDAGVGADHEFAPVAQGAIASPHLLTVHDVVIAVQPCFRLQTGEIGTRVRLRKALAPDFLGTQNFRNVAFLLRFGSTGDDSWSNQAQTQCVGHGRCVHARHLFPKESLLHQSGTAATVFLGP